jgi:Ni,Fe-hydrogenase III small subunit
MSKWVVRGLRTGIRSTAYPDAPELAEGVSPGRPLPGAYPRDVVASLAARCPTGALIDRGDRLDVDVGRCVHCYRCARDDYPVGWSRDYEWATLADTRGGALRSAFGGSLHVLVVDAGDCGACLHEVEHLNNPYYNMHRLGFFLTPTPRHADVLVVVGPVSDQMRVPLLKTYEAMPQPKRVVAVGACALSGSVFGPSFVSGAGVGDVLPVDVEVPGQPPPPLAVLHGLLVAVGRASPAELTAAGTPAAVSATQPADGVPAGARRAGGSSSR